MLKKFLHIVFFSFLVIVSNAQDQKPSIYEVTKMTFNEGYFSEISPVIFREGVIFCSDRRFSAIKDRKTFEGRRLYNLYYAERKDSVIWNKPEEIITERTKLFNNGPMCIAPDGKTVYFTSDVETGKITRKRNFKNHNGIFIAELSGTALSALRPFPYNNQQYDVGQPSVSSDGKMLFFASNMPGGNGGSDLYYCELINGEWSTPVNMGPKVNSTGTESFPFMHSSGRLYFSSNRPGGKGKMDVYFTMLNLGSWEEPVAMPDPINSADDDFAFVADAGMQRGYFSSNRSRNDDIYEFSSLIIRIASCDTLEENNYCFQMVEENAVKIDTVVPYRYEWDFGDGSPKGIGPVVIHCYSKPGIYYVNLNIVDLITKEIIISKEPKIADAKEIEQPYISAPDEGIPGQKLIFNADSTNLPGWNITQYYWNFDDGSIAIGKEVDKTFIRPGTYNVQLIVTAEPDQDGVTREACICKNVVISKQP